MRIQGVLFDMDGVLIDSEQLGMKVFNRECEFLGLDTGDVFYRILGTTAAASRKICRERLGEDFPYDQVLGAVFQATLSAAMDGSMPLKPGLTQCLEELKEMGIRRAIATSTASFRVEKYLQGIPAFRGQFDGVICGDFLAHSKPEPDIYLAAAQVLNLSPENCLGVEDSRAGVESVHRSGAYCVMIPDLLPFGEDFAPWVDRVLPSLTELPGLIREINEEA